MLAIYDPYSYIPFIVLHEQMLLICNCLFLYTAFENKY